eukprot:CAMPEP_0181292268 /NCGR_PEP_ID=MMETSP1101-20121128/2414_1 /TAXON_ID=46948 /ORGANISM="Rhodomonas abbreviata, Strain Caron Lab Isolate" /LENGTH=608 /DNA_ID=CAMNT_0023396723 /DNA_START=147 /DNA_END=1969 /DNA_ORIENTATION=+
MSSVSDFGVDASALSEETRLVLEQAMRALTYKNPNQELPVKKATPSANVPLKTAPPPPPAEEGDRKPRKDRVPSLGKLSDYETHSNTSQDDLPANPIIEAPPVGISGLPQPPNQNNIPWSSFPVYRQIENVNVPLSQSAPRAAPPTRAAPTRAAPPSAAPKLANAPPPPPPQGEDLASHLREAVDKDIAALVDQIKTRARTSGNDKPPSAMDDQALSDEDKKLLFQEMYGYGPSYPPSSLHSSASGSPSHRGKHDWHADFYISRNELLGGDSASGSEANSLRSSVVDVQPEDLLHRVQTTPIMPLRATEHRVALTHVKSTDVRPRASPAGYPEPLAAPNVRYLDTQPVVRQSESRTVTDVEQALYMPNLASMSQIGSPARTQISPARPQNSVVMNAPNAARRMVPVANAPRLSNAPPQYPGGLYSSDRVVPTYAGDTSMTGSRTSRADVSVSDVDVDRLYSSSNARMRSSFSDFSSPQIPTSFSHDNSQTPSWRESSAPPTNLTVNCEMGRNGAVAKIEWAAGSWTEALFELQIMLLSLSADWKTAYVGGDTRCTIPSLRTASTFALRVRASDAHGSSDFSPVMHFVTPQPAGLSQSGSPAPQSPAPA